jgi:hypothetical protein
MFGLPLTATVSGIGCLVLAAAWLYLGNQIQHSAAATQRPVQFMHRFFLNFAIFLGIITIPYVWLRVSDDAFSQAMAWGYVIGHIFTYLGLMYISRMVFALVPKLAPYDKQLVWVWLLLNVVATIIGAVTTIWGTMPVYNHELHLTEINSPPIMGALIGIMAVSAFVPAVILFAVSTFKSQGYRRIKSAILTLGFTILMIAGPIHDVVSTGFQYAMADVMTLVALLIIGTGVAFRLETGLAAAPRRFVAAGSNTV